jgi:hypothetical protein
MASDYHFGILLKLFFSLCPFVAWSLYCRPFFDLRPLIAAFGMFKVPAPRVALVVLLLL